ncbi:MAG: hypothetical protein ACPGUV_07845 [Polyangiales bacterium]
MPARPPQQLRLGIWHLPGFGRSRGWDFEAIAEVVRSHYDMVALLGVAQVKDKSPGYEGLLLALGEEWTGVITHTPRPRQDSRDSEHYAVIWRWAHVRPCGGWTELIYVPDHDGGPEGKGPDRFLREPAIGCFTTGLARGDIGLDFLLALYHAPAGRKAAKARTRELEALPHVFRAMADARSPERDLWMAGAFEAALDVPKALVERGAHAEGEGNVFDRRGKLQAGMRDHLLIFDRRGTQELQDVIAPINLHEDAKAARRALRRMGSHLPLLATFNSTGPDDD